MRLTRILEEDLVAAHVDPRVRRVILEMAERIQVQHKQIMQIAEFISKSQDQIIDMLKGMGVKMDEKLLKEGIGDMSGQINKMDTQDDDPMSTHEMTRDLPGKKH